MKRSTVCSAARWSRKCGLRSRFHPAEGEGGHWSGDGVGCASGDIGELDWLQNKAIKGVKGMHHVEGRRLEEEGVLEVTGGSEFGRRSLQMCGGSATKFSAAG
jgi:hypothetical protein